MKFMQKKSQIVPALKFATPMFADPYLAEQRGRGSGRPLAAFVLSTGAGQLSYAQVNTRTVMRRTAPSLEML